MNLENSNQWLNVIGLDKAKQALEEAAILPMKFPQLFEGNRQPLRGILLYGPPGSGKTLLARSAATESGCSFFSIYPIDLIQKQLNNQSLIIELFQIAKLHKPSLIFIDDIDELYKDNGENYNQVRQVIIEELQQQIRILDSGVIVMAAVQQPWLLDAAVRRAFEKRIYLSLPDELARQQMIQNSLSKNKHTLNQEQIKEIAKVTEGYQPSDISVLVRDALYEQIRMIAKANRFKVLSKRIRKSQSMEKRNLLRLTQMTMLMLLKRLSNKSNNQNYTSQTLHITILSMHLQEQRNLYLKTNCYTTPPGLMNSDTLIEYRYSYNHANKTQTKVSEILAFAYMIKQNINQQFTDGSSTHSSTQRGNHPDLTPEDQTDLATAFMNAQKYYHPDPKETCKSSFSDFVKPQQRENYLTHLKENVAKIQQVFLDMPHQKVYHSVHVTHKIYTRQTYCYLPKFITQYTKKQQNIQKALYRKLLKYKHGDFELNPFEDAFAISCKYFDLQIIFKESGFFVGKLIPKDNLDKLFNYIGYQITNDLNKLNEILPKPEIQQHENLLIYIHYYLINALLGYQYKQNVPNIAALKAQYKIDIEFVHRINFEDLLDSKSTHLRLTFKQTSNQFKYTIVKSDDTFYLKIQKNEENKGSPQTNLYELYWSLDDNLEYKLKDELKQQSQIQELSKDISTIKIDANIYYKLDSYQKDYIEDKSINQNFKDLPLCRKLIQVENFDIWFDNKSEMRLRFKKWNLDLTLKDMQILRTIYHVEDTILIKKRIQWILLRQSITSLPLKQLKLSVVSCDKLQLVQRLPVNKADLELVIKIDESGIEFDNKFISSDQILLSQDMDEIHVLIIKEISQAQKLFYEKLLQQK